MAYGQAPFMRFYESKNGFDNRFEITGPVSGCMLYYDATLGKFVNSNSLLFDPVTFTFTVHQIDADILTATTQLTTDGSLLINDSNPLPVANFEMSVISGILIFSPIAQIIPLTTGLIYFDYTGSITVQGNNCSLKIYDRSTINVWSIFSNAGLLSFYNGTTVVGTINQTGITTLVPQKIQNTLQTTGTQFLCMMPLSATTSAGQVIGTHATLSYNVATASLSATTFIGSLTGSCTLVDTTLQTTGTQFLSMVPLSATSPSGQVVGTHNSLNYDVATGTLNSIIFSGSLTGSATLIDTTAVSTNATYYLPFVPLATTQSSGQVLGTDVGITYNPATNGLTTTGSVTSSFVIGASVLTSGLYFPYTGPTTNDQSFVWDATVGLSLVSDSTPAFDGHLTLQQINIKGTLGVIKLYEPTALPTDYWDIKHLLTNKLEINYNGTPIGTFFTGGELDLTGATAILRLQDRTTVNSYGIFAEADNFYLSFANGLKYPMIVDSNGQITLEGTNASLLIKSLTVSSLDKWRQYVSGASGNSNYKIDYFNGSSSTTITPFEVTPVGSLLLGTTAGSGTDLIFYGTGTNTINTIDADKGKIEFLMNNIVKITAGGTSAGTATLNNAGLFTVSELFSSSIRMNGATNRQGFAYVPTNLVAQNVASGTNFGTGNYAFLAINGTTWSSSSDRRLKYDIKPFESCLDKILALNPVTYKWIHSETPAVGFIAQEVLPIIPEIVIVPEDPGQMMGLDLTNMTSFLVKAIQEQHLMILDLQNKINMLLNGKSFSVAP